MNIDKETYDRLSRVLKINLAVICLRNILIMAVLIVCLVCSYDLWFNIIVSAFIVVAVIWMVHDEVASNWLVSKIADIAGVEKCAMLIEISAYRKLTRDDIVAWHEQFYVIDEENNSHYKLLMQINKDMK